MSIRPSMRNPAHILLVEDSPSDRLMTTMAIRDSGVAHVLHTVEHGTDVLRFLRRERPYETVPRPDLILLDLNLPRMDGREILMRIKADPVVRTIPIVVLTTSDAPRDVQSAYAHHANAFLRKSTEYDEFAHMLAVTMRFWCEVVTPAPAVERETVPSTPHHEQRVLFIEASPSDALLVRAALAERVEEHFDVTHVDRIARALDLLDHERFDLILTDLHLPDAHGVEAVQLLASASGNTPIIVMTGSYADLGEAAISSGADDFLPKGDLSGARLTRVFRNTIRRRQIQQDALQAQRVHTVGRLAASVAHDMNNLLAAIRLDAEELLHRDAAGDAAGDTQALARDIFTSVERGSSLSRQLVTFGRRSAGSLVECEANEAVVAALSMVSKLLDRRVVLDVDLANGATTILADPHQVEQAVVNVALNANDAMPTGGALRAATRSMLISAEEGCRCTPPVAPGAYIVIEVEDSGTGIPSDILGLIFEPFFTTKREHEGTGLGLATVREIARLHHGGVCAENRPEGGARFTLLLPAYRSATPRPAALTHGPAADAAPPSTVARTEGRAPIRLLLVEDDPAVRVAMQRALRARGYVLHTTETADEAWRVWQEHDGAFDVLLTDLLMPGSMHVADLVEQIHGHTPWFPVVYCSGYTGDDNQERLGLQLGENFVPKPFRVDEVDRVLRHQLTLATAKASG